MAAIPSSTVSSSDLLKAFFNLNKEIKKLILPQSLMEHLPRCFQLPFHFFPHLFHCKLTMPKYYKSLSLPQPHFLYTRFVRDWQTDTNVTIALVALWCQCFEPCLSYAVKGRSHKKACDGLSTKLCDSDTAGANCVKEQ
jgi:hypothetical protein